MADAWQTRALLDQGPHAERLLARLAEQRAELTEVRGWLASPPEDASDELVTRTVLRAVQLQQQIGGLYRALVAAHDEHGLPRKAVNDLVRWAVTDYADLADLILLVSTARAARWWPMSLHPPTRDIADVAGVVSGVVEQGPGEPA